MPLLWLSARFQRWQNKLQTIYHKCHYSFKRFYLWNNNFVCNQEWADCIQHYYSYEMCLKINKKTSSIHNLLFWIFLHSIFVVKAFIIKWFFAFTRANCWSIAIHLKCILQPDLRECFSYISKRTMYRKLEKYRPSVYQMKSLKITSHQSLSITLCGCNCFSNWNVLFLVDSMSSHLVFYNFHYV